MSKEKTGSENPIPKRKTESSDAIPIAASPLFTDLSEEWKEIVLNIEKLAEQKLKVVDEIFTHYNSHDIKHALRVVNHFCAILDDIGVLEEIMGKEEALVSLCACLLHDVGMGPLGPEEDLQFKNDQKRLRKKPPEPPIITADVIDEWRDDHHNRTADWILKSELDQLKAIDSNLRRSIAEVARAHRKVSILHHSYFSVNKQYAFLGAVLRIADQMDIMPERIKDRFEQPRESLKIELEQESPEEEGRSLTEWLKVFAEKDWKIIHQGNLRNFVLTSKVWDDELTHRTLGALEMLVDDIEKAIEETRDIPWNDERKLPTKLATGFEIKGQICDTNHRLSAEYIRVWKYLVERLYPPEMRNYVGIREAVSNALDSCKLLGESERRQARCVVSDLENTILIEDNGVGLSLDIIENYLKVLGSSYYQSSRFEGWLNKVDMEKPSLIGQFGIGAFSYLLISQTYQLETKMENDLPYLVQFSPRFGITFSGTKETHGTIVTIPCSNETRGNRWKTSDQLLSLLTDLFPVSSVPLFFRNNDSEIQVGHLYSEEKSNFSGEDKSIEIAKIRNGNGFKVGLLLNVNLNETSSLDVLEETQFRSITSDPPEDTPIETYPLFLYSGLRISATSLGTTPYVVGLLTIADCTKQIQTKEKNNIYGITWADFDDSKAEISLTKNQFENLDDEVFVEAMNLVNDICKESYYQTLETDIIPSKILLVSLQAVFSTMIAQLPKEYAEIRRENPSVAVDRIYKLYFEEERNCLQVILNHLIFLDYREGNEISFDKILELDQSTEILLVGFKGYQDELINTIDTRIEFPPSQAEPDYQSENGGMSIFLTFSFSSSFLHLVKWFLIKAGFKNVECSSFESMNTVLEQDRVANVLDKIEMLKQQLGTEAEEIGEFERRLISWTPNLAYIESLELLLMLIKPENATQIYPQVVKEVASNHLKFILETYQIDSSIIEGILDEIVETKALQDNEFIYKIILSVLEYSNETK